MPFSRPILPPARRRPAADFAGCAGPHHAVLSFFSGTILRLTGLAKSADISLVPAHEEIRGAIDLHHQEGAVRKGDRDMLGGILDLGDTTLEEIMIHRSAILTLDGDLPSDEIVAAVLDSPYTRIPLWRNEPENITGVLHAKDLLRALANSRSARRAEY